MLRGAEEGGDQTCAVHAGRPPPVSRSSMGWMWGSCSWRAQAKRRPCAGLRAKLGQRGLPLVLSPPWHLAGVTSRCKWREGVSRVRREAKRAPRRRGPPWRGIAPARWTHDPHCRVFVPGSFEPMEIPALRPTTDPGLHSVGGMVKR